uniref:Uncharacterized protein n=1 Tax=Amphimedon queenslandica TaxID=400682 RepID=A0A1X7V358_AMPQE
MATASDSSSPEYVTLEKMLSTLVDNLADHADVIPQLNTHLLSSGLITRGEYNTAQIPKNPYERCNSMLTPVLAKVKSNPGCLNSLIQSLKDVGLNDIVFKLKDKLQSEQQSRENEKECDYKTDSTYGKSSLVYGSNTLDDDDEECTKSLSAIFSTDEVLHSLPFPCVQLPPNLTYALIKKMLEEGLESVSEMITNLSGDNDTQSSIMALQQFSEQFSFVLKLLKENSKSTKVNNEQKVRRKNPNNNPRLNRDVLVRNFMKGNHDLALSSLLSCTDSAYLKTITSSDVYKPNLLHWAAHWGWIDIIEKLIDDHGFDPMSTDFNGETAVYYAVKEYEFEAFELLVTKYHCNPLHKNAADETPLFMAIKCGSFDVSIIKYYITSLGYDGNTICNGKPLGILAAEYGRLHILKYLIEECKFDANKMCSENNSALDFAARSGNYGMVKYLILEHKCDPSQEKDWYSMKPLHHASEKGHIYIVRYLISECHCNVHDTAKGLSSLQYAAENGHIELVKYFVVECNCNPEPALWHAGSLEILQFLSKKSDKNPDYNVSLANAIKGQHIDAVKYLVEKWGKDTDLCDQLFQATRNHNIQAVEFLINECQVNVKSIDNKGRTLLHYAAEGEYTENKLFVLQCLLATGLDPLIKDEKGDTALDIATSRGWMTKDIFDTFGTTKTMYPVDSYVNIMIVGNSGAGKSTLGKVIEKTTDDSYKETIDVCPNEVEPLTAGIVPIKLDHKQLRNIVLHDFAGHSEYHLSHTAVIENILEGAGAVIIIVVDVSNSDYLIHLKQWLGVVRNEIQKAKYDCHIIVVASHVDCLSSDMEKETIIGNIVLELNDEGDIEYLDCRKLCGERLDSFFLKVQNACSVIRNNDKRSLTLYCHMMYNLLQSSQKEVLTLIDIVDDQINKYNHVFLPFDAKLIFNILSSLHSTGLIYYLNCEDVDDEDVLYLKLNYNDFSLCRNVAEDSKIWVVKNKMKFLKYVNGIIFSPKTFKENPKIKENGIITVPFLKSLFPEEDLIMIISFLESMGLCHIVSPLFLLQTNLLKEKDQISPEDVLCLFFPSHVDLPRPQDDDSFCFGWFLECIKGHQLFSQRFFNSLILHLTLKHSPEEAAGTVYHTRQCNYWKNGVKWCNENGVVASLELVNDSRCVLIVMSCDEGDEESMISLRRTIIKDVLSICRKYCPTLKVEEFVIDPDCLKQYPIEKPRETTAYCVKNMRNKKKDSHINPTYPICISSKTKRGKRICDILPHEPDYDNLSIFGEVNMCFNVY